MAGYGLIPGSGEDELQDWLDAQAGLAPSYLRKRRRPEMTFTLEQAAATPRRPAEPLAFREWIAGEAAKNPRYLTNQADQPPDLDEFIAAQAEQAAPYLRKPSPPPEMTVGLGESDRYRPPFNPAEAARGLVPRQMSDKERIAMDQWDRYERERVANPQVAKLDALLPGKRRPDMEIGLDEWDRYQAEHKPMEISLDEWDKYQRGLQPDMEIGLDEADKFDKRKQDEREMLAELDQPEPTQPSAAAQPEPTQPEPTQPQMDLTQDPEALAGSDEWQKWNTERAQQSDPTRTATQQLYGKLVGLLPKPDAEMSGLWRAAEQRSLKRSGYGGDNTYGIGEGLRDFAPMAIAGILDALINKGRGLPYLAVGGMNANVAARKEREAREERAGKFALEARQQREMARDSPLNNAYKIAQMQNWADQSARGWGNLDQRQLGTMIAQARLAYEQNPKDPQALKLVALVQQLTGIDLAGLSNKGVATIAPIVGRQQGADLAEGTAASTETGRTKAALGLEPQTTEAAAHKAEVVAKRKKQATNPQLTESGEPILPPGVDFAGAGYGELAKRNPEMAARVLQTDQDMEALRRGHANLMQVRIAIDQIPLEHRTMNDPAFAKLFGKWQADKGAYQKLLFDAQNRGVPQAFEQHQFDIATGDPQTWEGSISHPLESIRSAITDQQAQMSGQAEAMERNQAQFRAKWGFQPPSSSMPKTQAPPSAAQPAGPQNVRMPATEQAPEPEFDGRANYIFTIEMEGQPRERRKLTEAEVEALRAAGARVY